MHAILYKMLSLFTMQEILSACEGREDSPYSADERTKVQRGKGTGPRRAGTRSSDSYFPDLSLLLPQNLKFAFLLFSFHTYFKEDREI